MLKPKNERLIKMRKFFSALLLISFLVVLVFPRIISAQQETLQECCKLSGSIEVRGKTCDDNAIVAATY